MLIVWICVWRTTRGVQRNAAAPAKTSHDYNDFGDDDDYFNNDDDNFDNDEHIFGTVFGSWANLKAFGLNRANRVNPWLWGVGGRKNQINNLCSFYLHWKNVVIKQNIWKRDVKQELLTTFVQCFCHFLSPDKLVNTFSVEVFFSTMNWKGCFRFYEAMDFDQHFYRTQVSRPVRSMGRVVSK